MFKYFLNESEMKERENFRLPLSIQIAHMIRRWSKRVGGKGDVKEDEERDTYWAAITRTCVLGANRAYARQ